MQKWKVCKKLMAVILTLCMVLPLISNQYLVVRAEETGTGTTDTKKLSDLIAASDYVPVDLTKGEDVTLTDRTWTTDSYEYVTSYYQGSDNAQKQTKTDRGTLYQIRKLEGETFRVETDLESELLWYEEDHIDDGYSQAYSQYNNSQKDTIYLWISRENPYGNEIPESYTITFTPGKKISEYKDKAADITLNQTITLDTNADNYIKDVSPDNWYVCDGWLYKSSFESGYYTLNLDNNSGNFQIEVFTLNQEGQYQCTSERYTDESNSQEEQLLFENGYIFIRNVANAENMSISLDTAKKLSELTIPELVKGESYTSTSEDSSWKAGAYGYQHRIYKISVAAGKMASVFVKKMNDSSARRIEVLDENRMELEEKDFSISGSTTSVEQHLILNNDTNTEKVYYVGVYAMDGTETYTISYEDIATIDAYAEKAVSLTEETPITFAENDARLIKYVSYEYDYTPARPCYTEGALVTFDVPAKTSATFKLANDSSYTNYSVYTDLAHEESRQTVGTASYAVYNDTDTVKKYYVLIPVNQAVNATVSVKMKKSIQLREVPELQVGDNTVTTDAQTVEYTYAGTTEYWNGHVYQFTVPDEGTYAIGLKYTGTDLDTFKSMELDMYSSDENGDYAGYINNVSTNNYDKMNVLSSYLENDKTYYFKLQYTVDNQAITEAKDMQGVTIFIEKDVPEIKDILDSAQTITAATEDAVSGDDMRIVNINENMYCGKLYQITIPADYEAAIEADKGRVDIYEQVSGAVVDTSDYVRSSNWNENAIKGVLQNNSDEAKTYYVFVKSPFSKVTIGEFKQQTPATSIESANIAELTLKDAKLLSDLKKQNISFSVWDYNTNTVKNTKKESYWLKFTVPENEVYTLDTSYSETYGDGSWTFTVWSYYDKYDAYVSGGNHLVNSGNYTRRMDRFTEGTYYIAIEGSEELLPIQISLNQMAKIDSLKDSAVEISDTILQAGSVTLPKLEKEYAYLVGYGNNFSFDYGNLMKVTVPKHTTYMFKSEESGWYMYLYEEDFNKAIEGNNQVSAVNTTDTDKTYYIWSRISEYSETITIDVSQVELLSAKFDTAEKLEKGNTVTYQYSESDQSYMKDVTYYDGMGGSTVYQYKHAKLYYLDAPGMYSLSLTSKQDASNVSVTVFDKNQYIIGTYAFENKAYENDYYLVDGEKTYILISQDSENPDAEIELTLSDVKEDRLLTSNLAEAETIKEEKTALTNQDEKKYVFKCKGEDANTGNIEESYAKTTGKLYKYVVEPWSDIKFTADTFQGRIWIFDQDGNFQTYEDVWYDTMNYIYTNDSSAYVDLYLMSDKRGDLDGTLTIKKINSAVPLGKYAELAIELPESYTTSVDKILTVQRPYKDADYEVAYKEATGKLYSFKVPAKNKVEIAATKNAGLVVYSDLDDAPIADEMSSVTFNNLANEEQTYYLWVEGDNDGVVVTTTKTSLESKKETTENGEKVETTVDTTDDDTLIIIAEDKDTAGKVADATVKVEQKGGISEDAIKKSIDVVSQYNSDNDGKEQISNIQASYTDDSQTTVSSDVLNSLKDAQVSLDISKKASDGTIEYTWSFDADSLKETDVTSGVNTKLEVFEDAEGYEDQKVVDELTDPDATKCVVAFAHDGKLPKNTKVTIAVGDQYADGTTVYYYHINKETNILEPIDSVVVENGMVTLVLSHCSDYVICDKKVCKHEKTEVRNAKKASCTEAGYTGDTYCVDCDAKLATGEVIAKKDHTSSDWIVDKAATVDAEGSRHKECTVCKTVLAKEAIAKLPAPTPTPEPVVIPDVTIRYTTHVQTFGWQGDENNASKWFVNGKMAGTSGKAKRLEGIKIRVYGNDNLGIQYTTHCQSYGWLPWSANGEMNGTEGEAKRLEAIKIQLTGADKDKYDVYYRVHAQSYGWLGWAKNGAPSGTAGYAKRLEGIQIVVVKKGAAAPGVNYAGVNAASGVHQAKSYIAKAGSSPVVGNQATSNTNPSVAGEANVNVAYRTHVQTFGWQGWKYNGQMSGTSGQAKRLEGINIKLTNKPYSGSIVYTTHVQTYGWQGNENNPNTWRRDGDMSGTSGEAKRLEAIRIALTGEMAEHYDVYYRVHAQSFGWLGWAKNGEAAGTAGLAKRLEGIQIVLVPKNGKAPTMSYQGITSVKAQAYIKK